jgi:uncharacterized SAM-binding protein YcdF (DUF218 family)
MKRHRLGLFFLVILIAGIAVFRGAGRWLNREDLLAHADVIFVLGGGMPQRAAEAGRIYAGGFSPEVWLSQPGNAAAELGRLGIHFVGEEDYNRQILMRAGVPENVIHVLPGPVINTEQELQEAARELRRTGKTSVIFVTSPQHTRRVWTLWHKVANNDPRAILHAAHEDPFDADHWWRNTRDVLSVVRESLGLLNAWAGLPVPAYSN